MDDAKREDKGLDMTPMIDVTFLLLIFFMVASKFKLDEGRLDSYLPRHSGPAAVAAPVLHDLRLILRNRDQGCELRVHNKHYGFLPDAASLESLEADLREARAASNQDTLPVIIDAGADVEVGNVVATLNSCLIVGLTDISYARQDQLER